MLTGISKLPMMSSVRGSAFRNVSRIGKQEDHSSLPTNGEICSVASEFFCAYVVVIHARLVERLVQPLHHFWRTGNVVGGRRGCF